MWSREPNESLEKGTSWQARPHPVSRLDSGLGTTRILVAASFLDKTATSPGAAQPEMYPCPQPNAQMPLLSHGRPSQPGFSPLERKNRLIGVRKTLQLPVRARQPTNQTPVLPIPRGGGDGAYCNLLILLPIIKTPGQVTYRNSVLHVDTRSMMEQCRLLRPNLGMLVGAMRSVSVTRPGRGCFYCVTACMPALGDVASQEYRREGIILITTTNNHSHMKRSRDRNKVELPIPEKDQRRSDGRRPSSDT
ncbi:unnamed protein product [Arctogadus glacialis]